MPVRFVTALCCLCAGLAVGQATPKAGQPGQGARPGIERTFRGSCSEAISRDLFSACDADGDDRLDVFEASEALDTVREPRDTAGFARLDGDRDGYVTWPEFQTLLQATLQRGDAFKVRTVRAFRAPAEQARPAAPVLKLLQLYDTNQNGGLDPGEIDRYLRDNSLPGLGTQLRSLDADRNGRVDAQELAPWLALLPGRPVSDSPASANARLPEPWDAADTNQNGSLDAKELAVVLRRLDPSLAHWAADLLRALDRSRDGALQPDELPPRTPLGTAAGAN